MLVVSSKLNFNLIRLGLDLLFWVNKVENSDEKPQMFRMKGILDEMSKNRSIH